MESDGADERAGRDARALREFCELRHWRRSMRGNLTRVFDGLTLTVFKRRGEWHWCVAGEETTFSPYGYECEYDAMYALAERTVGDW